MENSIPLILHQIWLDKNNKGKVDIPDKYKELGYSEILKTLNPTFKYELWNQEKIENLLKNNKNLSRWKDFYYNGLTEHMERCDFSRYLIMYTFGGIYLDLDFKCFKSLLPLLNDREIGIVFEPDRTWNNRKVVVNGFMLSRPNHHLWYALMNYIMEKYNSYPGLPLSEKVLYNTGPYALSNFIYQINLQDRSEYFIDSCLIVPLVGNPLNLAENCVKRNLTLDDAYTVTFWNEGTRWQHNEIIKQQMPEKLFFITKNTEIIKNTENTEIIKNNENTETIKNNENIEDIKNIENIKDIKNIENTKNIETIKNIEKLQFSSLREKSLIKSKEKTNSKTTFLIISIIIIVILIVITGVIFGILYGKPSNIIYRKSSNIIYK